MNPESMPETIGYLLAQTCKRHRFRAHAQLEAMGLYRGQQFILMVLWEQEGRTHSELAEVLHVQPATMSNALKRMAKAGFVERRPDPDDQRVSRVYLTDAGRAVRDAVEQMWRDMEAQTFAGFSPDECLTLRGYLLRIIANLTEEG
ncbi:MAG: MarR family transcriptional regulator [Chloroflexi bacterium]|nr:MarR family transcriptional regulator [Chloroflexota bacterium]MBU1748769.1 MarR family transcriptional regulator [Chloroflexota bacterium]MBU1879438.1 MarR family transcriptional regulator [Chloroflexota bacterium]